MTQVLTVAEVKRKARKAYNEGKLTAQHPKRDLRICEYQVDQSYHCAIGAALNKKTIQMIRELGLMGQPIYTLLSKDVICTKNSLELSKIQKAHDSWAVSSEAYGSKNPETKLQKKYFLDLIK